MYKVGSFKFQMSISAKKCTPVILATLTILLIALSPSKGYCQFSGWMPQPPLNISSQQPLNANSGSYSGNFSMTWAWGGPGSAPATSYWLERAYSAFSFVGNGQVTAASDGLGDPLVNFASGSSSTGGTLVQKSGAGPFTFTDSVSGSWINATTWSYDSWNAGFVAWPDSRGAYIIPPATTSKGPAPYYLPIANPSGPGINDAEVDTVSPVLPLVDNVTLAFEGYSIGDWAPASSSILSSSNKGASNSNTFTGAGLTNSMSNTYTYTGSPYTDTITETLKDSFDGAVATATANVTFHNQTENWTQTNSISHPLPFGAPTTPSGDWIFAGQYTNTGSTPYLYNTGYVGFFTPEGTFSGPFALPPSFNNFEAFYQNLGIVTGVPIPWSTNPFDTYTVQPGETIAVYIGKNWGEYQGLTSAYGLSGYAGQFNWDCSAYLSGYVGISVPISGGD